MQWRSEMFDIYIFLYLYLAMESVENCVQAIKDHFHASVNFGCLLIEKLFSKKKEAFDYLP